MDLQHTLQTYFKRLWPICRSITGDGLRDSLRILSELIPLEMTEVPSGTQVFDWQVPEEWNIRDAYIINPEGEKIADFKVNNLHIVNYSSPVNSEVSYDELAAHMHTIPEIPDAIPYVTTYYKRNWGFCMSDRMWQEQPRNGKYKVVVDSVLKPGSLTYGQCELKGESNREIFFSTYVCHPSMANNELSGPLVAAFLYQKIAAKPYRRFTYRFLFAPETIGVIAFLAKQGNLLKQNIEAGYVLTCCGDNGPFTYKRSKHSNTLADRAAEHLLRYCGRAYRTIDFAVGGSDERQYCSPGFNMPVGSLMRTPYQQYKEYHTSLDNESFISYSALEETIDTYYELVQLLELNDCYKNKIEYCEPQLGKRGLYPDSVDPLFNREELHRLLHFLSFADGQTDLIEIAAKRNESALLYTDIVRKCKTAGLI